MVDGEISKNTSKRDSVDFTQDTNATAKNLQRPLKGDPTVPVIYPKVRGGDSVGKEKPQNNS